MQAIDFEDKNVKTTNFGQYLLKLQHQKISGTLSIEANVSATKTRTKVLVLRHGEIIYAGDEIPTQDDLITKIGKKYKPNLISVALKIAKNKAVNQSSIRELLDILVQMRLFKWKEIEEYVYDQTIRALEQVFPYFCKLSLNQSLNFDLSFGEDHHGFNILSLIKNLQSRQKQWKSLQTYIYSMEAIPHLSKDKNIVDKIDQSKILQHIKKWINNQNSLVDIAQEIDQDALKIANFYFNWAKKGWIKFPQQKTDDNKNRTEQLQSKKEVINDRRMTILTVDDSPTVHNLIQKFLGNQYNIILATNAIEGLKILNKTKVDLVLLDVGLPNIDGLQMCKTIRNMERFKKLPIIMLTGKDTLVDKLKGQIAGTTHYLTKPFSQPELYSLVNKYLVTEKKLVCSVA